MSLQTLDEKTFDHGTILAQSPAPGHIVPPTWSIEEVTKAFGLIGAEMLVQGLRDGVHVPPHREAGSAAEHPGKPPMHAPKVTKADAQVNWGAWTADDFRRRMRVFGSVWTRATNGKGEEKRVIFQDAEATPAEEASDAGQGALDAATVAFAYEHGNEGEKTAVDKVVRFDERSGSCAFQAGDGAWIRVSKVKVDGKAESAAVSALRPFRRRTIAS